MFYEPIKFTPKWWKIEGVNNEHFTTKAALEARIRGIINRAAIDAPITDTNDLNFLVSVLRRHYEWVEKQGCGVSAISVRMNGAHLFMRPTRGIWITRTDNTDIDISWVVALKHNGARSPREDAVVAGRHEISRQIENFRKAKTGAICELCGKPVDRGHVDHAHPLTFSALFQQWADDQNIRLEDIEVENLGTISQFADKDLSASWRDYHKANARLRFIHDHENLAIGGRAA